MKIDKETCIDIIQGEPYCSISTMQSKYIEDILLLKDKYPDEVKIIHRATDKEPCDAIVAQVPASWFRFVRPKVKKKMSEEQKNKAKERMRKAREAKR